MKLRHMRIQQDPPALVGDCETGDAGIVKVRVTLPLDHREIRAHMLALENVLIGYAEKELELERRAQQPTFKAPPAQPRHRNRNRSERRQGQPEVKAG